MVLQSSSLKELARATSCQNDQRQNWGTVHTALPELDLAGSQIESYKVFLEKGIQETLTEVYSDDGIEDYTGKN